MSNGARSMIDAAPRRARGEPEQGSLAFPLVQRTRAELERRARRALSRDRLHGPDDVSTSLLTPITAAPGWLMWRGVPVSPELQRHAERVARGEVCTPFRGPVLSSPSPAFLWDLSHAA